MKFKSYGGFTLIEMVVVMGILILLMAIGIGGGRMALNAAADSAHQASVKQIYEASMAFYSRNGYFPKLSACDSTHANNFACLLGTTGPLANSIESFDGGNEATYYYITDSSNQFLLVCTTLGGLDGPRGMACEGNGFGQIAPEGTAVVVEDRKVEADSDEFKAIEGCENCFHQEYVSKAWK